MKDKSIWVFFLTLLILGVFLGAYDKSWQQGAKRVMNNNNDVINIEDENINIELIWDASGSMWGKEYGIEKILMSKNILKTFAGELPKNINLGLRIFGARKSSNLKDSFLAVPILNDKREDILNFITNVKPLGKSPIGYSLQEAQKDLEDRRGKKFILLVSDGIDNGDIPPINIVKDFKEKNIVLHIIYIGNQENIELVNELKELCNLTGGNYFSYDEHNKVIPTLIRNM